MKIFDGKKLADKITTDLKKQVKELHSNGVTPKLVILAVEPDERSQTYIKAKIARAKEIGIETEVFTRTEENIEQIKTTLAETAKNESVHGIIVQLPLPFNQIITQEIINLIPHHKDVDGLTTTNTELIANGNAFYTPATPLGILEILKQSNITINSKTIAIIGQGKLVGAPLAEILKNYNTNLLIADQNTKNLNSITQQADIIISAAGQAKLITADMIKGGVCIIDAGVSIVAGKLAGDVDFESVAAKTSFITPAIGGVGPMTVIMLMKNVIEATKRITNS